MPIAATDIENIIFGLKMSDEHKERIKKIKADNGWKHVRLWDTIYGEGLFDLGFMEVTE